MTILISALPFAIDDCAHVAGIATACAVISWYGLDINSRCYECGPPTWRSGGHVAILSTQHYSHVPGIQRWSNLKQPMHMLRTAFIVVCLQRRRLGAPGISAQVGCKLLAVA